MNSQLAVASYAQVHCSSGVEAASPHKLIDMLFDGALERIIQAKGAMEFGNIELKGAKINSAIAIVGGLRESLDSDQGGDIADNLDALYVYIQNIMMKAHLTNEVSHLEEASNLLGELQSAWKQIGE